jgi:hypothetical protein
VSPAPSEHDAPVGGCDVPSSFPVAITITDSPAATAVVVVVVNEAELVASARFEPIAVGATVCARAIAGSQATATTPHSTASPVLVQRPPVTTRVLT